MVKASTMKNLAEAVRNNLKSKTTLSSQKMSVIMNSLVHKDIIFTTSKTDFTITMRGTGKVTLYINDKLHARVPLNPE